jgi:hypothetical protein
VAAGIIVFSIFLTGCQPTYNGNGIMYGCDGSGAGVIVRWGPSARKGMTDAGFKGIMEPYRWQTGAGFAVDHMSSPEYKRGAAKGLAEKITDHRRKYPDDPIYLGGLSAGCAVVLYALEELPADVSVDQVILLSSSVSADFDLTPSLRHVRGRIYAFTSDRDAVLRDLAANFGTADGKKVGTDIAGIRGFHEPGRAAVRSETAYGGKVQNIAWRQEFAKYGHNGGHTEVVASAFVERFIAPLVVPASRSARQRAPGELWTPESATQRPAAYVRTD